VDGRLKVTGGAKYAAEYPVPNVAYAVMVTSTIGERTRPEHGHHGSAACAGRARGADAENAPKLPAAPKPRAAAAQQDNQRGHASERPRDARPDDHAGRCRQLQRQPIGLVIADTFEHATAAVGLVKGDVCRGAAGAGCGQDTARAA
jgi:xanthine dehydrogenase YagR molybdenum-binding subunit